MPTIRFETTDRDVPFAEGDEVNLLRVAIRNDCGVPFKCASGNCGTDRVRVLAGAENLMPSRKRERERLGELVSQGYRLAGQTYGCGDVTIAGDPGQKELEAPGPGHGKVKAGWPAEEGTGGAAAS